MATKKKTPKTEVTLKADEFSTMLRGFLKEEGACDGDWHEKAMKQIFGITPSKFVVNFEIPFVFKGQATVSAFSSEDAKQQVLNEVSQKAKDDPNQFYRYVADQEVIDWADRQVPTVRTVLTSPEGITVKSRPTRKKTQ